MEIAKEIGYDFVQGLPLWGINPREVEDYILHDSTSAIAAPKYYEGPWNAVPNLRHAWKHLPGSEGKSSGPLDWFLFPPEAECAKIERAFMDIGARKIGHSLHEPGVRLTEIHKGLKLTPAEIARNCEETGQRLVLDTRHLAEMYDHLGFDADRYVKQAVQIVAKYIDVIHVQPAGKELSKFIRNPMSTDTGETVNLALQEIGPDRPVDLVAEYNPGVAGFALPFVSSRMNRTLAKGMLQAMFRLAEPDKARELSLAPA